MDKVKEVKALQVKGTTYKEIHTSIFQKGYRCG